MEIINGWALITAVVIKPCVVGVLRVGFSDSSTERKVGKQGYIVTVQGNFEKSVLVTKRIRTCSNI